jgi:hypothetical protein
LYPPNPYFLAKTSEINAKEFLAFKKILPHSEKMSSNAIGLPSILEKIWSH